VIATYLEDDHDDGVLKPHEKIWRQKHEKLWWSYVVALNKMNMKTWEDEKTMR